MEQKAQVVQAEQDGAHHLALLDEVVEVGAGVAARAGRAVAALVQDGGIMREAGMAELEPSLP